jgi:hypothetical protein
MLSEPLDRKERIMKNSRKMWRRVAPAVGVAFWLLVSATIVLAQGAAVQRPIEDFVDAQGTYCIDDGSGGCLLIVPPIPNFVGFSSPEYCASVDYAGLVEAYWGGPFGTTTKGSVTERPLPDGRAEVSVRLLTANALTWVVETEESGDCDYGGGSLMFGQRSPEGPPWENAALGQSLLKIRFINSAPGAPLPDLIQLLFFPEADQETQFILFTGRADGPLRAEYGVPDGTPGRVQVIQTGLFMTNSQGAPSEGFPGEHVHLRVVGH